jgi:hypothetical protein
VGNVEHVGRLLEAQLAQLGLGVGGHHLDGHPDAIDHQRAVGPKADVEMPHLEHIGLRDGKLEAHQAHAPVGVLGRAEVEQARPPRGAAMRAHHKILEALRRVRVLRPVLAGAQLVGHLAGGEGVEVGMHRHARLPSDAG